MICELMTPDRGRGISHLLVAIYGYLVPSETIFVEI
jgi:hypothetical protein